MGLGRYITRTVKPLVKASIAHLNAFTANDLLFDWTSFTLPQGGSRLVGVTAIIRSTDGADQIVPMDLFFARNAFNMGDIADGTAPTSLGTPHAAPTTPSTNPYYNNLIGHTKLTADNFSTAGAIDFGFSIGTTGYQASTGATAGLSGQNPLIFEDYGTTPNDGLYTFYVGATCIATPDFHSDLAVVSVDGLDITCDGTDARTLLAPGDVLEAYDINVDDGTLFELGTVASIPDATSVIMKSGATNLSLLQDGDNLYNINPIKLILTFER